MTRRNSGPTGQRSILARQRQQQALLLRLAGLSMSEIGVKIGMTKARVGQYLKNALEEFREDIGQGVEELRAIETAKLDQLQVALSKRINETQNAKGGVDIKAVNSMLRLMERRAALLGLDVQPQKERDDPNKIASIGAAMFTAAARVLEMERQGILPRGRLIDSTAIRNEPTDGTANQ